MFHEHQYCIAAKKQEPSTSGDVAPSQFTKGRDMENPLGNGQPIPTGIIMPTDIIPPQGSIPSNEPAIDDVVQLGAFAAPMMSATQLLTGMMFGPFLAWTSMTNSYLRFFDLSAFNTGEV